MQVISLGARLHKTVPPERWCVTKADLLELRQKVRQAIENGKVTPTERDPFDLEDHIYGPCIHTVVQQFIKPVTHAAGDVSWALMLHPEGLQCDLFVTHCWQEGIYELLDQVLGSWPVGAKHVYCCMLSNPQNLNISDIISCPTESPFAKNLRSAIYMLVVPNRKCSIYTRIWCVYEAYLGERWGKIIYTATCPIRDFWWRLLWVAIWCVLGICISILGFYILKRKSYRLDNVTCKLVNAGLCSSIPAALYALYGRGSEVRKRLASLFCAFCMGLLCGMYLGAALFGVVDWFLFNGFGNTTRWDVVSSMSTNIIWSLLCDADRQWKLAADEQARQLRHGYTGSVIDARSSKPQDKERIVEEILAYGSIEHVDDAIRVLIRSGMSTPELRELSACGIDVEDAGMYKRSSVFLGLNILPTFLILFRVCYQWHVLDILLISEFVASCAVWLWLPIDRRPFVANLCFFLMAIPTLLFAVIDPLLSALVGKNIGLGMCGSSQQIQTMKALYLLAEMLLVSFLYIMALALSVAGPARVARIPRIGPCIARTIVEPVSHLMPFLSSLVPSNRYSYVLAREDKRNLLSL